MKKSFFYAALALTMGLASCSNSDDVVDNGTVTPVEENSNVISLAPAQKAKVFFASNGFNVSEEAPVKGSGPIKSTESTEAIDIPALSKVVAGVLGEGKDNTELMDLDFMFYADEDMDLEFYPVYKVASNTTYQFGIFYYDENGKTVEQKILTYYWDNDKGSTEMNSNFGWPSQGNQKTAMFNGKTTSTGWGQDKKYSTTINSSNGIKISVKKGYKFGFFFTGSDVNKSMDTTMKYYSDQSLNTACTLTDEDHKQHYGKTSHAGTFNKDGRTYVGFEDWNDFDYQDIVFVFNKEVKTIDTDEDKKPTVDPKEDDKKKEEEEKKDPAEPTVTENGGSIEANLAINDPKETGDWIESHLAIHVRDTSDVEVFLPVPAQYYCAADDMFIVEKHDTSFVYSEYKEFTSMTVGGQTVSLTITYGEKGITLKTSGINADVLKYCREKWNDGLTFEVRNYYNTENGEEGENKVAITRDVLKKHLDQAVITFVNPTKTYVNAKGFEVDKDGVTTTVEDALSCTVTPADVAKRDVPTAATKSDHEKANLYIYPLKK